MLHSGVEPKAHCVTLAVTFTHAAIDPASFPPPPASPPSPGPPSSPPPDEAVDELVEVELLPLAPFELEEPVPPVEVDPVPVEVDPPWVPVPVLVLPPVVVEFVPCGLLLLLQAAAVPQAAISAVSAKRVQETAFMIISSGGKTAHRAALVRTAARCGRGRKS